MQEPARAGGRKVERQELQISVLAERENESRALLASLRQVDLGVVITALGGQRDGHRWCLGGDSISITGEKFCNHARQQGGTGAIELVQHATGYTFQQAVAWMRDQFGVVVAVVAAARHARQIAETEPSPPPTLLRDWPALKSGPMVCERDPKLADRELHKTTLREASTA